MLANTLPGQSSSSIIEDATESADTNAIESTINEENNDEESQSDDEDNTNIRQDHPSTSTSNRDYRVPYIRPRKNSNPLLPRIHVLNMDSSNVSGSEGNVMNHDFNNQKGSSRSGLFETESKINNKMGKSSQEKLLSEDRKGIKIVGHSSNGKRYSNKSIP